MVGRLICVRDDAPLVYILQLPHAVFLLSHNLQILSIPLGLSFKCEKVLHESLVRELDEDTSLESLVTGATQTYGVDGTVGLEVCLDVKLGFWALFTETLGVDATGLGNIVLRHELGAGVESV